MIDQSQDPARDARRRRRPGSPSRYRLFAFAAVGFLVVSGATAAVAARNTSPSTFTSTITASHSGLCLTSPGAGAAAATGVTQQPCNGSAAQTFTFAKGKRGYTVQGDSGCFTVPGGAKNGSPVTEAACPGVGVKLRAGVIPGAYQLVMAGDRCVDVLTGATEAGIAAGAWGCADPVGAGNQTFGLVSVPTTLRSWAVAGAWKPPTIAGGTSAPTPSPNDDHGHGGATVPPTTPVTATPPAPTPPAPTGGTGGTGGTGDWKVGSPVSTQAVPGALGTNPDLGKTLPPANAPLSRAFITAVTDSAKGYSPKAGECAVTVHARYWTWGADGKVYPTWHPAKDPSGCAFGHEHGDDPRNSALFAKIGLPPFGYTNEQLAPSNPASQRDEDHVGHKIAVQNKVLTREGNNPRGTVDMACDTYIKFHQGTHSADALTNNLHEIFYNVRCEYADTGKVSEGHIQVLLPIGRPGEFKTNNGCDGSGLTTHSNVGPVSPADSPDGGFSSRRISDIACAERVKNGQQNMAAMDEIWQLELHYRGGASGLNRLDFNPYMIVGNPSRFHDPKAAGLIGRNLDLCYAGARGAACDKVRALGEKITWDDPRSPFTGARRHFDANRFVVVNNGPTTLYSDVFGRRFATAPFPGSIKQFVSGSTPDDGTQGDIFQPYTDYGMNGTLGVRAPN